MNVSLQQTSRKKPFLQHAPSLLQQDKKRRYLDALQQKM